MVAAAIFLASAVVIGLSDERIATYLSLRGDSRGLILCGRAFQDALRAYLRQILLVPVCAFGLSGMGIVLSLRPFESVESVAAIPLIVSFLYFLAALHARSLTTGHLTHCQLGGEDIARHFREGGHSGRIPLEVNYVGNQYNVGVVHGGANLGDSGTVNNINISPDAIKVLIPSVQALVNSLPSEQAKNVEALWSEVQNKIQSSASPEEKRSSLRSFAGVLKEYGPAAAAALEILKPILEAAGVIG